jgi:hypothetical protein
MMLAFVDLVVRPENGNAEMLKARPRRILPFPENDVDVSEAG